ncbi:MAG TPA: threonine/serine exporter family protein [Clostridiaceae bacterium]
MIINSLYALFATFCFGIIFNIRGKKLAFASLGGGLAWFMYLFTNSLELSTSFSLFVASIIATIYSEIMARRLKTTVTTFVICAILPLVPGNGMYYTMYQSILGQNTLALNTGIKTLASAGAIAAGIVLISSTTKLIKVKRPKGKAIQNEVV